MSVVQFHGPQPYTAVSASVAGRFHKSVPRGCKLLHRDHIMKITSGAFNPGFDNRRGVWTQEHRKKAVEARKRKREETYSLLPWLKLPKDEKRRRVLAEQDGKCLYCRLDKWQGTNLTLELDHVDGVKTNDARENVRFLCPNCHSQTPTWRRKKKTPP